MIEPLKKDDVSVEENPHFGLEDLMEEPPQSARIRLANGQRVRTNTEYPDVFGTLRIAMAEYRWASDNLPEAEREAHFTPFFTKAGIAFQRQRKLEEQYGHKAAEKLPYTLAGVIGLSRWGATLTPDQGRRFMEHIKTRFGITNRWVAQHLQTNLSKVRAWSAGTASKSQLMEELTANGILAALCQVNQLNFKEVKKEFPELKA